MSQVNTHHLDYDRQILKWQRCRDAVSGQDAIHAAGERYLPRLAAQTDADYNAYKIRALFYNATWRTIAALNGMIFRRPPVVNVPDSIRPMLDDITMSGVSFYVFAQRCTLDVLTTGRIGILVDYPPQEKMQGITLADAQRQNLRPFMKMYPAESIINWKCGMVSNQYVLTQVALAEEYSEPDGEFAEKTEIRYRVLDLFNGAYRVRVFRINSRNEDEQVEADRYPMIAGKVLDWIPFYFIGIDDTTPDMDDPPLIDLVDANLAHYRLDADHKHGLHFTGLPTPVVSGYVPETPGERLYIGSSHAWTFPDPQTRAYFLEYQGQGLNAIAVEKEKLEQLMAILGARLLTAEKKDAETAQTAAIHRAGENSILAAISHIISAGLTMAMKKFCEWAGADSTDVSVELNSEFLPSDMTPQELTSLVSAWQQGAISMQVLFNALQKAEVIASDLTLEEMQSQIESAPIPTPGVTE